ncbi:MAG: glucose-1-phosphate cytidylyltransferase [Verrucomicrobia bacterium]|nr:glucose-1-phosphate cytidylyltransferase [Verrucomicrobiota bacterium]
MTAFSDSAPASEMPPLMILCGGKGTRLRDVTELLPKPMVPIGEQPIVWHIMRSYAAFGVNRFILCLGYKRDCLVDYFLNFHAYASDVTVRLGHHHGLSYHDRAVEADWEVTLANTGIDTMTGGRVAIAAKYLKDSDSRFFLTYGDAVSDLDIAASLEFHRRSGKLITVAAVHPEGRFGEIHLTDGRVHGFEEKPACVEGYINGGFMVLEKAFVSRYLATDKDLYFEQAPMRQAIADEQMAAFPHEGFWQCMDTPREYQLLNDLWKGGAAPWTAHWQTGAKS